MKEKIKRFKNEKTVINVRSKKQYDEFMKMCEKQGLKWCGGELPTKDNVYNDYEEKTCINLNNLNYLTYSSINYFKNYGYEIITYEDFIKEEPKQFTKSDLKDNHIERISGLNHPSTERLSSIREDIGLAFETIDKLIDKVNKLEEGKK